MIGVSPAYFFTRHSYAFTADDVIGEIPLLKAMGVTSLQGEVFLSRMLEHYEKRATELCMKTKAEGLAFSQFVAHFLSEYSKTLMGCRSLSDGEWCDKVDRCLQIAQKLETQVMTIPIAPFSGTEAEWWGAREIFINRILRNYESARNNNVQLALEIMPGALIAGARDLESINSANGVEIGITLDTGHAINSNEDPVELAKGKIVPVLATHLKDFDKAGRIVPLGTGVTSIGDVILSLEKNGYERSYDPELPLDSEAYRNSVEYIERILRTKEK